MLSKIVGADKASQLVLEHYTLPSPDEVDAIIEDKKREARRRKIVLEKDDPLQAARKEANKILVEAQEKLKDAQMEAAALKTRQEREIRAQMEKEFQLKLEQELKSLKQNYFNTLETLGKLKDIIYKQNEKDLMDLVFSITRKIIGDEVKTSPQVILGMLKKGVERFKDAVQYEIKIHPADYEMLIKEKESLKEILKNADTVKYTQDEKIERGGCVIITESGEISSEPGKQLDVIEKELSDET